MPEHENRPAVNAESLNAALAPLLDRIGARSVTPEHMEAGDIPVEWAGAVMLGVRLGAQPQVDASQVLQSVVSTVETELGGPLRDLSRADKQRAVRLLEQRGAFTLRKSVETVAQALGVTRFTVYNYLNRDRAKPS
jgi:hypothetical protein